MSSIFQITGLNMEASPIRPGFKTKKIKLKEIGSVVRNDIKDFTSHGTILGVVMKFKKRLDLKLNSSQGLL